MPQQKSRPLDKLHLQILHRISRGSKPVPIKSRSMWRFSRGRHMYADFLLDELRQAGLLTQDNQVTAQGELFLLVNS